LTTLAELFPVGTPVVIRNGYGFSLCNGLPGNFHRADTTLYGKIECVDAVGRIIIALDIGLRVYTSSSAVFRADSQGGTSCSDSGPANT
jgi:hypothetical protein